MFYYNNYWGMNLLWWFIWCIVVFWIFATPYDIPGQRRRKDSALDILNKRFAKGELNNEEYQEKRKIIENDLSGLS
jgi:putative membrane protein